MCPHSALDFWLTTDSSPKIHPKFTNSHHFTSNSGQVRGRRRVAVYLLPTLLFRLQMPPFAFFSPILELELCSATCFHNAVPFLIVSTLRKWNHSNRIDSNRTEDTFSSIPIPTILSTLSKRSTLKEGCELFSSTRSKTFVERYNILKLPYCLNLSNELAQNVKKQMKLLSWNPLSFLSPQIYKEGVEWDENTKENISWSVIKNTKSKSRIKSCQQKFCAKTLMPCS